MSTPTIQFGILAIPYQTLDVAGPIDILSSCSSKLLELIGAPESLVLKGIDIQFHHIGLSHAPQEHTANFHSVPTTTIKNCPKLDYLLVGGPMLSWISDDMEDEWKDFIRKQVREVKGVFATCTGGMVLAAAGVLDGLEATTNHEVLPLAMKLYPNVRWKKEQWVIDGKFRTAGGACAGMDMMGDWVLQNYDGEVARVGLRTLDFEARDVRKEKVVLVGGSWV